MDFYCRSSRTDIIFIFIAGILGDLTFMRACGQSVLVLNSLKAATDLLDKRGITYAHRPSLVMAGELMGLDQVCSYGIFALKASS